MHKTKPAFFRFSSFRTVTSSLRLPLVAASVLCVLPVQAQTADDPDASLPDAVDDTVVVAPARRPIEQPAQPVDTAEDMARKADEKREAADRQAWQQARVAEDKSTPDKRVQSYQGFLKSHPDLHPAVAVETGVFVARLQEEGLKDPDAALSTLQMLWQSYQKHPAALSALGEQAGLMTRQGKAAEAEVLAKPLVERALLALEAGSPNASAVVGGRKLLQGLVASLRAQGKGSEAVPVLLRVLRDQPVYLDAMSQADNGWMYRQAVDSLIQDKKPQEALKWAKLCFVQSRFDKSSLGDASQVVAKALGAADASGASLEQWAKAQQDAQAPNPLRDVKMPLLSIDETREKLKAMGKGHKGASQRIGLLLWLGDEQGAMEESQHMLDGLSPQEVKTRVSEPVLEACRVFKARDLNLKGGNAYLKWLHGRQGANPVEAFLGEAAPVNAAAPVATADDAKKANATEANATEEQG